MGGGGDFRRKARFLIVLRRFATLLQFFFPTFATEMMRRAHTFLLTIATICMMVMVVTPHHHDAMGACFVLERCQQDGHLNDRHTHHPADNHHIIPVTGKHISVAAPAFRAGGHSLWLPLLSSGLAGEGGYEACLLTAVSRRAFAPAIWHGQPSPSGGGLRAPPYFVL